MNQSDYLFRLACLARCIAFDWDMTRRAREIRRAVRQEIREKFAAMLAERFGPVGITGSPFDHREAYGGTIRNWPIQAMNAQHGPFPDFVIGADLATEKDRTVHVTVRKPRNE